MRLLKDKRSQFTIHTFKKKIERFEDIDQNHCRPIGTGMMEYWNNGMLVIKEL